MIFHFQLWILHIIVEKDYNSSKFGAIFSLSTGLDIFAYGARISFRPKDIRARVCKIHALQTKYLVTVLLPIIFRKRKIVRVALFALDRVVRTIRFFKRNKAEKVPQQKA